MAISQNFPNTRPSLNLNFARSKTLDPRITFSRTSAGTYVDDNGFIKTASADEPRFDHDHTTGESLGLLVEEARSNYYHVWNSTTDTATNINSAYIDTQTTSSLQTPLGVTATAYTATKTGNSGQYHGLNAGANSINITSDTSVSFSAYLKEFNSSDYRLYFVISAYNASTNNRRYCLNVARPSNGTWIPGSVDSRWSTPILNVKDCGNGWYRYEITSTNTYESGWNRIDVSFQLLNESSAQFYDPPTANTHGLYLSAPQVEVGAFPTSYIPIVSTDTTTRTADSVSMTGTNFSDWYNPSEGSIYVKYNINGYYATDGYNRIFEITDGTNSNWYAELLEGTNSYLYDSWIIAGSQNLDYNTSSITFGDFYQIAVGFGTNLTRYTYDASGNLDTLTDTSIGISTFSPTKLLIGMEQSANIRQLNGHISHLSYYPTKLSDDQLQNLILQ